METGPSGQPESPSSPPPPTARPSEAPRPRRWTVVGAVAIVLVFVGGAIAGLIATGVVRPLGAEGATGRIAYVDPEGRLSSIAPDGTDHRYVAPKGATFLFPAWSPDRTRIAAIGADRLAGVYVLDDRPAAEAATLPAPLGAATGRAPFYLYWTPDGRAISYLVPGGDSLELRLATLDAEGPDRLLFTGSPLYWQWSADGEDLLVHAGLVGEGAFVGLLRRDGSPEGPAVDDPGFFQAPGLGGSASLWAYASGSAGRNGELVVSESVGGDIRNELEIPFQGVLALSWSPAGDRLAFTSPGRLEPRFAGPLAVVDLATGRWSSVDVATVVAFFWSPDGRRIAAIEAAPQIGEVGGPVFGLKVIDVPGGALHDLGGVRLSSFIVNQFLRFFDQYALSHRVWSPRSDALVLPLVDGEDDYGIWVIPTDGGPRRRVADGVMASWSP